MPSQINLAVATERDAELGPARAMTDEDFLCACEHARVQAEQAFFHCGRAPAVILLPSFGSEGIVRMGVMPVDDLVSQPVGKELLVELAHRLTADANYDLVVLVHEASVLSQSLSDEQSLDTLRSAMLSGVAAHPASVLRLVVTIRSQTRMAVAMLPIARLEDGSVSVGLGALTFTDSPSVDLAEGRLLTFSRPPGTTLH